ncbi:hypothetical protein MRB53_037880 [Persea americana]|nr:hypothetical protein MRB53_037880 [Persea americana]
MLRIEKAQHCPSAAEIRRPSDHIAESMRRAGVTLYACGASLIFYSRAAGPLIEHASVGDILGPCESRKEIQTGTRPAVDGYALASRRPCRRPEARRLGLQASWTHPINDEVKGDCTTDDANFRTECSPGHGGPQQAQPYRIHTMVKVGRYDHSEVGSLYGARETPCSTSPQPKPSMPNRAMSYRKAAVDVQELIAQCLQLDIPARWECTPHSYVTAFSDVFGDMFHLFSSSERFLSSSLLAGSGSFSVWTRPCHVSDLAIEAKGISTYGRCIVVLDCGLCAASAAGACVDIVVLVGAGRAVFRVLCDLIRDACTSPSLLEIPLVVQSWRTACRMLLARVNRHVFDVLSEESVEWFLLSVVVLYKLCEVCFRCVTALIIAHATTRDAHEVIALPGDGD